MTAMLRAEDAQPASLEGEVDKGQEIIDALNIVTDRMVDDVTAALAELGLQVAVTPQKSETTRFGDWRNSLAPMCVIAVCRMPPLKGQILMSVPAGLVSRLTDIFFGGDGEHASERIAFTPTEQRIFLRLADLLADAHSRAWPGPATPEVAAIETVRNNLRMAREGDPTIIQSLTLQRGKINLGRIDFVHAAPQLRGMFGAEDVGDDEPASPEWRRQVEAAMVHVHLPVRSVIARPEITLETLFRLAPGDVIPIILPATVPIIAAGKVLARGSIGEANGHAAIQIEHLEERNE
jgi:flagellar motor switch protein FliM